jgi:hypothetical protein
MIVKIDRSFEKDTHKLKNDLVLVEIADCIENIQASEKVSDINGIKKLSGLKLLAASCEEPERSVAQRS